MYCVQSVYYNHEMILQDVAALVLVQKKSRVTVLKEYWKEEPDGFAYNKTS